MSYTSKCQLESIAEQDPFSLLQSLRIEKNQCQLGSHSLPCCSGSGFSFVGDSQYLCSLNRKISRVLALLQQFGKVWQQDFSYNPKTIERAELQFLLHSIQKYKSAQSLTGNAFCTYAKPEQPSLKLWHWALACIFCFDMPVQVITIKQSSNQDALLASKPKITPQIIFVEQKASFSDSAVAFAFDEIVSWTYMYNFPLWIDVLRPEKKESFGDDDITDVAAAFAKVIAKTENRGPFSWLGLDTRSKLREQCSGVDLYLHS